MFDTDKGENYLEEMGIKTARTEKKLFRPWHKPRKQWVREFQWWKCLESMMLDHSNLFYSDSNIRYFGLPGEDLLDVDYISKKMSITESLSNKRLLIHGILSSPIEQQNANSRLTKLLDRNNVDDASKVEHFNFDSLHSKNAVLWQRMKGIAPYHIVNLDFCEKVFQDRTIGAVHNLLDYQFQHTPDRPWIFCLTTKVDSKGENSDVLKRLDECLHKIEESELAKYKLDHYFKPVFDAIQKKLPIEESVDNLALFTDIYIVGFIIWLIIKSQKYHVSYKLKSSAKYGVHDRSATPDMFSFVFQFKREIEISSDDSGVAVSTSSTAPKQHQEDPREVAMRKLFNSKNIDLLLEGNATELQRLIDESKQALSDCGWDVSEYEEKVCPELKQVNSSAV